MGVGMRVIADGLGALQVAGMLVQADGLGDPLVGEICAMVFGSIVLLCG